MSTQSASQKITGVKVVQLHEHVDGRGRFMETFRKEWFPERSWERIQGNRSDSRAGVLRGLHYHRRQVDYWYAGAGRLCVGLADLRRGSPTFGASQSLEVGDDNQVGIFIPPGVAHGFRALSDATLYYIVDNYYDGDDEYGVAWNDPDLAIEWGVTEPILSERDRANPFFAAIDVADLPIWTG